jgi:hypothetical protein
MNSYQILLIATTRVGTLSSVAVSTAVTVLNFSVYTDAKKALSNLKEAYPKHTNTPTFSLEITELF